MSVEDIQSLQVLLKIVTEYPYTTIIVAFVLATIIGFLKLGYYFSQKMIDEKFENDENERKEKTNTDLDNKQNIFIINKRELPPLTESPLFPTIQWLKTIIKTNISTGNKGKDLVLQEIAIKKLEAWEKYLYQLSEEVEDCFCSCGSTRDNCNKLFDANMKAFDKAFTEYNNFWHNNDDYTEDEKWCLDYVMPIINKHHQTNVDDTMNSIKYSCESKYYDSCISRNATIFMTYSGALNKFTHEICEAFNEINGHMSGRVFKGIKI